MQLAENSTDTAE